MSIIQNPFPTVHILTNYLVTKFDQIYQVSLRKQQDSFKTYKKNINTPKKSSLNNKEQKLCSQKSEEKTFENPNFFKLFNEKAEFLEESYQRTYEFLKNQDKFQIIGVFGSQNALLSYYYSSKISNFLKINQNSTGVYFFQENTTQIHMIFFNFKEESLTPSAEIIDLLTHVLYIDDNTMESKENLQYITPIEKCEYLYEKKNFIKKMKKNIDFIKNNYVLKKYEFDQGKSSVFMINSFNFKNETKVEENLLKIEEFEEFFQKKTLRHITNQCVNYQEIKFFMFLLEILTKRTLPNIYEEQYKSIQEILLENSKKQAEIMLFYLSELFPLGLNNSELENIVQGFSEEEKFYVNYYIKYNKQLGDLKQLYFLYTNNQTKYKELKETILNSNSWVFSYAQSEENELKQMCPTKTMDTLRKFIEIFIIAIQENLIELLKKDDNFIRKCLEVELFLISNQRKKSSESLETIEEIRAILDNIIFPRILKKNEKNEGFLDLSFADIEVFLIDGMVKVTYSLTNPKKYFVNISQIISLNPIYEYKPIVNNKMLKNNLSYDHEFDIIPNNSLAFDVLKFFSVISVGNSCACLALIEVKDFFFEIFYFKSQISLNNIRKNIIKFAEFIQESPKPLFSFVEEYYIIKSNSSNNFKDSTIMTDSTKENLLLDIYEKQLFILNNNKKMLRVITFSLEFDKVTKEKQIYIDNSLKIVRFMVMDEHEILLMTNYIEEKPVRKNSNNEISNIYESKILNLSKGHNMPIYLDSKELCDRSISILSLSPDQMIQSPFLHIKEPYYIYYSIYTQSINMICERKDSITEKFDYTWSQFSIEKKCFIRKNVDILIGQAKDDEKPKFKEILKKNKIFLIFIMKNNIGWFLIGNVKEELSWKDQILKKLCFFKKIDFYIKNLKSTDHYFSSEILRKSKVFHTDRPDIMIAVSGVFMKQNDFFKKLQFLGQKFMIMNYMNKKINFFYHKLEPYFENFEKSLKKLEFLLKTSVFVISILDLKNKNSENRGFSLKFQIFDDKILCIFSLNIGQIPVTIRDINKISQFLLLSDIIFIENFEINIELLKKLKFSSKLIFLTDENHHEKILKYLINEKISYEIAKKQDFNYFTKEKCKKWSFDNEISKFRNFHEFFIGLKAISKRIFEGKLFFYDFKAIWQEFYLEKLEKSMKKAMIFGNIVQEYSELDVNVGGKSFKMSFINKNLNLDAIKESFSIIASYCIEEINTKWHFFFKKHEYYDILKSYLNAMLASRFQYFESKYLKYRENLYNEINIVDDKKEKDLFFNNSLEITNKSNIIANIEKIEELVIKLKKYILSFNLDRQNSFNNLYSNDISKSLIDVEELYIKINDIYMKTLNLDMGFEEYKKDMDYIYDVYIDKLREITQCISTYEENLEHNADINNLEIERKEIDINLNKNKVFLQEDIKKLEEKSLRKDILQKEIIKEFICNAKRNVLNINYLNSFEKVPDENIDFLKISKQINDNNINQKEKWMFFEQIQLIFKSYYPEAINRLDSYSNEIYDILLFMKNKVDKSNDFLTKETEILIEEHMSSLEELKVKRDVENYELDKFFEIFIKQCKMFEKTYILDFAKKYKGKRYLKDRNIMKLVIMALKEEIVNNEKDIEVINLKLTIMEKYKKYVNIQEVMSTLSNQLEIIKNKVKKLKKQEIEYCEFLSNSGGIEDELIGVNSEIKQNFRFFDKTSIYNFLGKFDANEIKKKEEECDRLYMENTDFLEGSIKYEAIKRKNEEQIKEIKKDLEQISVEKNYCEKERKKFIWKDLIHLIENLIKDENNKNFDFIKENVEKPLFQLKSDEEILDLELETFNLYINFIEAEVIKKNQENFIEMLEKAKNRRKNLNIRIFIKNEKELEKKRKFLKNSIFKENEKFIKDLENAALLEEAYSEGIIRNMKTFQEYETFAKKLPEETSIYYKERVNFFIKHTKFQLFYEDFDFNNQMKLFIESFQGNAEDDKVIMKFFEEIMVKYGEITELSMEIKELSKVIEERNQRKKVLNAVKKKNENIISEILNSLKENFILSINSLISTLKNKVVGIKSTNERIYCFLKNINEISRKKIEFSMKAQDIRLKILNIPVILPSFIQDLDRLSDSHMPLNTIETLNILIIEDILPYISKIDEGLEVEINEIFHKFKKMIEETTFNDNTFVFKEILGYFIMEDEKIEKFEIDLVVFSQLLSMPLERLEKSLKETNEVGKILKEKLVFQEISYIFKENAYKQMMAFSALETSESFSKDGIFKGLIKMREKIIDFIDVLKLFDERVKKTLKNENFLILIEDMMKKVLNMKTLNLKEINDFYANKLISNDFQRKSIDYLLIDKDFLRRFEEIYKEFVFYYENIIYNEFELCGKKCNINEISCFLRCSKLLSVCVDDKKHDCGLFTLKNQHIYQSSEVIYENPIICGQYCELCMRSGGRIALCAFKNPHEKPHLCSKSHKCLEKCSFNGLCQFKINKDDSNSNLKHMKSDCIIKIKPGNMIHEDTEQHKCFLEENLHFCDKICNQCGIPCEKRKHKNGVCITSHGIMKNTLLKIDKKRLIPLTNDIYLSEFIKKLNEEIIQQKLKSDIDENHKNEEISGDLITCEENCQIFGRGHLHALQCNKLCKDTPKFYIHSGEFDYMTCENYFKIGLNFQKISNNSTNFESCGAICLHHSHRSNIRNADIQYCNGKALHSPIKKRGISKTFNKFILSEHGHAFDCLSHNREMHIVVLLDAGVNMITDDYIPKEKGYQKNRLGAAIEWMNLIANETLKNYGENSVFFSLVSCNNDVKVWGERKNGTVDFVKQKYNDLSVYNYNVNLDESLKKIIDIVEKYLKDQIYFFLITDSKSKTMISQEIFDKLKNCCNCNGNENYMVIFGKYEQEFKKMTNGLKHCIFTNVKEGVKIGNFADWDNGHDGFYVHIKNQISLIEK